MPLELPSAVHPRSPAPAMQRLAPADRPHAAFGRRLATAAHQAGFPLTQARLAQKLGVSQATVSAWLRGTKLPSIERGVKVAERCGVNVQWLYFGQGHPYPTVDPPVLQLAQQLAQMPPLVQDIVRAIMATLPPSSLH